MSMKPSVQNHDPTPDAAKGAQAQIGQFLQQMFANGGSNNMFGNQTSPLQQQAVGQMSNFLNMRSPESMVNEQLNPVLMGMAQNPLQNPFGDMGAIDRGRETIAAAQPVFQQNLAGAQGQLNNAAPGRFGSAFVQQGIDQNSRALNDFNLFSAQAIQQGQQLQQQERQSALNFALGAQGMQQGAAGLMGQLAGQQGQNEWGRMLGAGQLGNQITQGNVNPMLQMMMAGMGWAQPMGQNAIVGPSNWQNAMQGVNTFANLWDALGLSKMPMPGAGGGG